MTCACLPAYIHMDFYLHTYVHAHIHMMHAHILTCTDLCMSAYIYTYSCMSACLHKYGFQNIHICIYTPRMFTYLHMHIVTNYISIMKWNVIMLA